jgi:hypothetical protein
MKDVEKYLPKKEVPIEVLRESDIPGSILNENDTVLPTPIVASTPENPPEHAPLVIVPIAVPAKKPRKPRDTKAKSDVASSPVVEEPRAEENADMALSVDAGSIDTARLPYLQKMIGFYQKANALKLEDITIALLRKDAFDMVEKDSDQTIQVAIDALKK